MAALARGEMQGHLVGVLREAMDAYGMFRAELARRAKVDPAVISNFFAGKEEPFRRNRQTGELLAVSIARVLKVPDEVMRPLLGDYALATRVDRAASSSPQTPDIRFGNVVPFHRRRRSVRRAPPLAVAAAIGGGWLAIRLPTKD